MKTAKIIGCGLSGITAAILLKEKGYAVKIYETRNHIGGNCYDSNVCGTLLHNYGPHIFHTDDEEVYSFLRRYTSWIPFTLRPIGNTVLGKISLPYSQKSISQLGRDLSQEEIINYIFKDYSEKQWGIPFEEIPKTITNRIPKTKNAKNPTWFEGQKYQCIPEHGYTAMMERMLDGIEVILGCDSLEWKKGDTDLTVYTGRVDGFYDYRFGKLPYRSLTFKHEVTSKKMDIFIQNECNSSVDYTRKYDHSYFTPNHKGLTVITEEYPKLCEDGDVPYYPIPWGAGQSMYFQYEELAKEEFNIIFAGRLATYKYLDMWMAIKQVMLKMRDINKV